MILLFKVPYKISDFTQKGNKMDVSLGPYCCWHASIIRIICFGTDWTFFTTIGLILIWYRAMLSKSPMTWEGVFSNEISFKIESRFHLGNTCEPNGNVIYSIRARLSVVVSVWNEVAEMAFNVPEKSWHDNAFHPWCLPSIRLWLSMPMIMIGHFLQEDRDGWIQ